MRAGRLAVVLARRAVFLGISLVIVVLLTAVIIGATGYDKQIWEAVINAQLRAYQMRLQRAGYAGVELNKILQEYKERLIKLYGLDKPWWERVFPLAIRTLMLDLGVTLKREIATIAGLQYPAPVGAVILAVLPRTIVMLTVAELICAAIALALAPLIAYKRGSLLDKAVLGYAALFHAVPVWWLAMVAIYVFGFQLGIAPTDYRGVIDAINNFWRNPPVELVKLLYYAYLPILVVTIALLGSWLYSIRAMAIRVVSEDYVTTAKAKGLPDRLIARRYILRVIAAPVATYVILALAGSLGGYIITEAVFDWPGMGTLYYVSIILGDVPTLFGLIYVTTLVYVIARFILEVLQVILDPRISY